jgi:transketolase
MDNLSKKIREDIVRISHHSGHGHIPTCFSIVEILRGVYETMKHDPNRPIWSERDLFVLSKGHAALGLYCTLAEYGYFPLTDVYSFGAFESRYGCHADRLKIPGVEASTGSLGHGIGIAVGMATGFKLAKSLRRVMALIGDGETNEGTVWEAALVAANLKLDNLTVILDNNRSQARCLPLTVPEEKFAAFGFNVTTVDGHDLEAVKNALRVSFSGSPHIIIADTAKGYGSATLTKDFYAWHRRSPNNDELKKIIGEINATAV